jgi:hypothetical protein
MNRAACLVNRLLEDDVAEGRLKALAAAGLIGAAAFHPGTQQKLKQAGQAVSQMLPARPQINNPNEELPSEKGLNDWEYLEKKSDERTNVAKQLSGFTKHFITGTNQGSR